MNLRLKRLELFGFKSFADKTVLDFENSFTGIVGPNGCGKSNVVDAMRWVLGEQRVKSLRGGEMADVIFKGSTSRPGLSVAEVTMVLDNSSGTVEDCGPEFSVTRRVYKSGEGEYLINGDKARLKDIRNLLYDTGLGSRGYSVLEQGRIDAVLSANPLERRSIFEEAAGISRYRQRKKEAESRLGRVQQDVSRLDDLLGELTRRVRSLKIQATKAEKYVVARDEWRTDRTRFLRHKIHSLNSNRTQLGEVLTELEARAEDLRGQRSERDVDAQKREEAQRELASQVDELSRIVSQLSGDGRAMDERQAQLTMRMESWRSSAGEETERAEHRTEQLSQREAEYNDLQAELTQRRERYESTEQERESLQGSLKEVQERYRNLRVRSQEQNDHVLELLHEKTAFQNRIRHIDESRAPFEERRQRVVVRLAEAKGLVESVVQALREVGEERVEAERRLNQSVERRSDLEAKKLALDEEHAALTTKQNELSVELARLQSRVDGLRDWERERESLQSGARALLDSFEAGDGPCQSDALWGLFADRVRTSTEWARALDAALGQRATALVARTPEHLGSILGWLSDSKAGEVQLLLPDGFGPAPQSQSEAAFVASRQASDDLSAVLEGSDSAESVSDQTQVASEQPEAAPEDVAFLIGSAEDLGTAPSTNNEAATESADDSIPDPIPAAAIAMPVGEGVLGRLLDRVESDPGLETLTWYLIGDCFLARDLDCALELARQHPDLRFVTPEGDLVDASGATGGYREVSQGAIGRRSAAQELDEERMGMAQVLEELQAQLKDVQARREGLGEELVEEDKRLSLLRRAHNEVESNERTFKVRIDDLNTGLERVVTEELGLTREGEELERNFQAAQGQLTEVESKFEAQNQVLQDLERERHAIEKERDEAASKDAGAQVELARTRAELLAMERRVEDLKGALTETREELGRAQRLSQEARENITKAEVEVSELVERVRVLANDRAAREVELTDLRDTENEGREAIDALRKDLEGVTLELERSMSSISDLQLQEQRLSLQREELLARSAEELEFSEYDLLEGFEPEEELQVEEALDALEKRAHELRRQLDRLGPVNTEALGELEETEERLNFLTGQRKDLSESRSSLEETLQTINEESRRLFLETFNGVRDAFGVLFRKLFGGGRADLTLEEGVDPLEAGIEITARPPGREMLPIGLLSGGQRTMTALGLLFAVFQTRPSPFCVLDEVDAALDDSNVGRFLAMLDSFRAGTQFVVVTHNKGTMAACDMLYGVTMETKGVSRHVSVSFGEIDEFVPEVTGNAEKASESRALADAEAPVDEQAIGDEQEPELRQVDLVPVDANRSQTGPTNPEEDTPDSDETSDSEEEPGEPSLQDEPVSSATSGE